MENATALQIAFDSDYFVAHFDFLFIDKSLSTQHTVASGKTLNREIDASLNI